MLLIIKERPTNDDPWGENAKIEYVGVDYEKVFHDDLISDAENETDYVPDTDEEDNDDRAIVDEEGCEVLDHVTDLQNPKIEVGVTLEDGKTFKRAIRQFVILNEFEIAAPYNEAQDTEVTAKPRSASGGYMPHNYRMEGHGWYLIYASYFFVHGSLY